MSYQTAFAAAVIAVVGSPVLAQGISGGQLGIEYSAPTDGSDFGGTTYSGGLEYAISRQFAVGVDISGYKPDNIDTDFTSATLHGIYHLSDTASAGVFFGRDFVDNADANIYGIEGGTEFMGGTVGGYIGKSDGDAADATLFGVDGAYALSNGFSVIGDFDRISVDDTAISQISLGAEYGMNAGPSFYAKVGNVSADDNGTTESQTFFTIGAQVAFGAGRGTTFDQRSVFETVPGF